MLFAIAKSFARYRYAAYPHTYASSIELSTFLQVEWEADIGGLTGIYRASLRFCVERLTRFGIYNLNQCRSRQRLFGGIDYASSYPTLVAQTHKARHIGLHHHFLGGHGLVFYHHVVHFLVGGQAHKAPCGDTFGQCELDSNVAIGIGSEGWIEESRLVQVLADGGFISRARLWFSLRGFLHVFRLHLFVCNCGCPGFFCRNRR